MKKVKKSKELSLNKLNVSNLQRVVGGLMDYSTSRGIDCNSTTQTCNSQSTRFTDIASCCSAC